MLEHLLSWLAPHRCVICLDEGSPLCPVCFEVVSEQPWPRCILCYLPCGDGALCRSCRRAGPLDMAWAAGAYDGGLKLLVKNLKFHRMRAAASSLAGLLDATLPELSAATVVTFVPTSGRRRRQRGYDQARLLAEALAEKRGWPARELLKRRPGAARQLGTGRRQRLKQAKGFFEVFGRRVAPAGADILLIDDVATTGASLSEAARVLKKAGAARVMAAVCAVSEAGRAKM